jgi:AcrR family transcriptional regulator
MSRIANKTEHRPYRSELREQQAKETRERILDATIRVMAQGVAGFSMPAVAREAGVSVPTVYRHFRTKAVLLGEIYPHLARRAGLTNLPVPDSVQGFREMVRTMFERLHSLGDPVRAAMASEAAEEARRLVMPERIAVSRGLAATVAADASDEDKERIARLMLVLASSSSMRVWLDHLGASVDQAADDIGWMLEAAIASAGGRKG